LLKQQAITLKKQAAKIAPEPTIADIVWHRVITPTPHL